MRAVTLILLTQASSYTAGSSETPDAKISSSLDETPNSPAIRQSASSTEISGNSPPLLEVREVGVLLNKSAQADAVGHGRPAEGIPAINGREDVNVTESITHDRGDFMRLKNAFLAIASVAAGFAISAPAMADLQLATAKNCMACHSVAAKIVGPAYKDVAAKYAGQKDAPAKLAAKVMAGGGGVWGSMPMPANPQVSPEEAKKLVAWVLSQK